MIPGFATVLAASANDRRDLFIGAAEHRKGFLGLRDALFNGLQAGGPRLLFQGRNAAFQGLRIDFALLGRHR